MLAVDPSSPFSGGALLGDRVRMSDHATDPGVFIRSMASRGHLGGLAWATPQALRVLDAPGFDVVVVETVGVGQSEVEVAGTADTTVVLLAPGMGDGIQAAKAGILEIGDVYVVNKADREGAAQVRRDLRSMLAISHGSDGTQRSEGAWRPPVLGTSATSGEGVAEVVDALEAHLAWSRDQRCARPTSTSPGPRRGRVDRAGRPAAPVGRGLRPAAGSRSWPSRWSHATSTPTPPPTSCSRSELAASGRRDGPHAGAAAESCAPVARS